jgi:patatin-related protein
VGGFRDELRELDIPSRGCHGSPVREKELRLALICYGGISLAVYMHGITKEIWRLARASRALHAGEPPEPGSEAAYTRLLGAISKECGLDVRVLVDILAGASAGGINAIFLAEAIASGRSLDPLTDLWLDGADVDRLLDPEVGTMSRLAKAAAVPFAWALSSRRGGTVDQTVEPGHRGEIRAKISNFVRARWFSPPFSGPGFTRLLLGAFDAMAAGPAGPSLLPRFHPLDLFVTVTDFHGYPERLRLNSPPEVVEQEHRLILSFRRETGEAELADAAELTFAGRATASFPGAFPPFQIAELDAVLAERGRAWPGRADFLKTALPQRSLTGDAQEAVLIDGSVLANAPFRPAIRALQNRPARREVDRRFVYIDPKPGIRSVRITGAGAGDPPGFFATIFGALSDIPREQPIRDNLEAIEQRSTTIRRLRRIVEAMRPEVEAAIERAFGSTLLLLRPTPKRLASWRARAQNVAAREAGYAYAAYGHLKLAAIVEEAAERLFRLSGGGDRARQESVRQGVWSAVRDRGLTDPGSMTAGGAEPDVVAFLRSFDAPFRTRRLRFLLRHLGVIEQGPDAPREAIGAARGAVYRLIGLYQRTSQEPLTCDPEASPWQALEALAARNDLKALDDEADMALTEALGAFPKPERRSLILAYLGFPFYDIATLPLLQGEGLDEYDEVKVDRISPEDATAIRAGGVHATLKGVQFNSFGAFFSRAYRENDYLWGRLHGADRLIDIVASTLPEDVALPAGLSESLKREAFRAILAEERPRLREIGPLFEELEREVG